MYPDFAAMKETIDNSPKWEEKVEAMKTFMEYLKSNGSKFPDGGEPVIVYCRGFSKGFKAANINILKISIDCTRCALEACKAGPRICSEVVSGLVPKVR